MAMSTLLPVLPDMSVAQACADVGNNDVIEAGLFSEQFLVRFCNETFVINAPRDTSTRSILLQKVSHRTGWPVDRLYIKSFDYPWVSISVVSAVVGGKGGFGTLLKGQSKQAGARMTTDFGACRDLQGRRLRHVNDEIKLRKWREMQQMKQQGLEVDEIKHLQTPSGILNWHLMVPNWASDSLSKKGTTKLRRKWERQIKGFQSKEEEARQAKIAREEQRQQIVSEYVRRSTEASTAMQENVADAIKQGMKQKQQAKQQEECVRKAVKRKRVDVENDDDSGAEQPQSLCTLSGDAVVVESSNGKTSSFQIQSKSEFCTVALVLERNVAEPDKGIWFEIKVVTGGLAQVGWAAMGERGFSPDTDTGNGVGDDACSFAYDGSRSMKFHNGTEVAYGDHTWKAGDVLGCRYNPGNGEISYSCNGKDIGVAFTTTPKRTLVPAMSCNQGEILELFVKEQDMQHMPPDCVPVYNLLSSFLVDSSGQSSESVEKSTDGKDKGQLPEETGNVSSILPPTKEESTRSDKQPRVLASQKKQPKSESKAPVVAEPLDLDKFQSVEELKELGLDRLKAALLALGVKCGGSLQERAERLFSLKSLKREDFPMKVRGKKFVV